MMAIDHTLGGLDLVVYMDNQAITLEHKLMDYEKRPKPSYYVGKHKGITASDIIRDFELSHFKASALEYILRSANKGAEREDLIKAINHLKMEIEYGDAEGKWETKS